ncbi:MAG TPA: hypothetical protein VM734_29060 [Kofleriaceae bacterium]|nr:hypothetical protein [Kofleriaceae bacterium]
MNPELSTWLTALGPAGPLDLDELAACFLRHCRGHAAALREARSAGLDRSLAGWRATLADAFRTVLRAGVATLDQLAARTSLEVLWERLHRGLPERPDIAAVLVARVVADALDEAVGHRYADCYRRRGRWRLAPGDPFPVAEPALRDVFGRHLTTHPDVRDLPIDRSARLALAPVADGVELVLELGGGLPVPGDGATVAVCLPHGEPARELDFEPDAERRSFFGVRPRDPDGAAATVRRLAEEALAAGAGLIVFPELAVADAGLDALARAAVGSAAVVVAGSRHATIDGAPRNVATVLAGGARLTSYKFNPFVLGDMIEGITSAPAQVVVRGSLDGAGRYAWSIAVLVCKDFLSLGAHQALTAARPSVIVVPAQTERTAVFEADAIGLTGSTQATCVVVNQVDARATAAEDPAVVIVTRPVPWALCEVVRRSEVTPPVCILLSLRPAPP